MHDETLNHQIRLAACPSGLAKPSDWELSTEPAPVPGPGEFVVAVEYLSIDPAMRRWISPNSADYGPVPLAAVMEAGAIGQVTAPSTPALRSASTSTARSGSRSPPAPTAPA
jgi:NADPH-dependent curcumin reductase CurA